MSSKFKQVFQKYSEKVKNALNTDKNKDQSQKAKPNQSSIKEILIWKNPDKINGKHLNNIESFFYLTERIIISPFPSEDTIEELSDYLNKSHKDQYIVYNLSEHKYDISYFNSSVMEYSYPGLPSAPLDVIFMICISMVAWLQIDPKNIVVIHCQGTKGRSALIASCFLAFHYYSEFDGPQDTYKYFCKISNLSPKMLLYPSQERYLNYFGEVLNGFILQLQPINKPLILQRIIMYGIPEIQMNQEIDEELKSDDENLSKFAEPDSNGQVICAPYIQIFKNGQMIFSSLEEKKLPNLYYAKDQCAIFDIGQRLENDFLIRCRHYKSSTQRVSMFRAAIHTSFIVNNVIRLTKEQLDGACDNESYPKDFFLDFIFVDARNQTNSNFKTPLKNCEETNQIQIINKQQVDEQESKIDFIIDPKEEEKKLMQGEKNVENKDDFWISIWDQIQNRNSENEDEQMQPNLTQVNSVRSIQQVKEEFKINLKESPESFVTKGRFSNTSNKSNKSKEANSPVSSNEDKIKWDQYDDSDKKSQDHSTEQNLNGEAHNEDEEVHEFQQQYNKQLTQEEKQKINQVISGKDDEDKSNHDSDNEVDNYLDNLENDSD